MKYLAFTIGGDLGSQPFKLTLPGQIQNLVNTTSLQSLITFILGLALSASVLLAFFFIIIGGFKWIMSQGDKKQLENAQKTILYAIIGLVIVLLSFFIINLIGFAFGVNLLRVQVP